MRRRHRLNLSKPTDEFPVIGRAKSGPSPLEVAKGLRSQLDNWYIVGPVSWLIMRSPLSRVLSRTWIARRVLKIKLRTGLRIQCRINEFIAFVEIFVLDDYDVPGLDWQSVRTIVDAGANIGVASIWFTQKAPLAKVVAVEPSPVALTLLQSNINANGLKARIGISPVALGGISGIGYLRTSESTVETHVEASPVPRAGGEHVAVTTLGQLARDWNLQRIDLLKLDCEGAEYDVLLSADRNVLGRIGTIVGEYHCVNNHGPAELVTHLESCGFSVQLRPHPREPTLGTFLAEQPGLPSSSLSH